MKIAILDDYQHVAQKFADWSGIKQKAEITVFDRHLGVGAPVAAALADFDVVCAMRERTVFNAAVLDQLPKLKLMVTTGMRNASIDGDALKKRGIPLCGTQGSGHSTAELAWGLALALYRHIPLEHKAVRDGGWQTTVGATLHGRTLGVLGLGNLGSSFARVGKAFGMNVIAWSPNLTAEKATEVGATRVEKDELLSRSDIVSIHLILGDRSRGLIGKRELGLMKPTAILINTSRGPIVDEAALLDALATRRIAGAGLDTYDVEPLPVDHPIRKADNVVLTPHLGYVTEESYKIFFGQTVENIQGWLDGKPVRVING